MSAEPNRYLVSEASQKGLTSKLANQARQSARVTFVAPLQMHKLLQPTEKNIKECTVGPGNQQSCSQSLEVKESKHYYGGTNEGCNIANIDTAGTLTVHTLPEDTHPARQYLWQGEQP